MRSVRDIPVLENIPVLVRASLNVPVENGVVTNTFRLTSALPTISYLRKHYARVVLISHITGKGTETLHPIYEALKKTIPDLRWCPVSIGKEAREAVRGLPPGGVLMLENLRRHAGEEKNDPEFAKELSMLGDVFVQDSFDVCHREHASVVGLPTLLPSYAGFTVLEEVEALTKALKPQRPALAVIGGSKFSTKEPVLKKLLACYDHVFIGGALANDFLKAKGYNIGSSLVSSGKESEVKALLSHTRLVLPVDVVVAPLHGKKEESRETSLTSIKKNEAVTDVGSHTALALTDLVKKAKTVLWNGPLGRYEDGFIDSSQALAKAITASKAHSIIGGGDTIAVLEELGLQTHCSFLSTGGGAMLDFLAYGTLPGLKALR